MAIVETLEIRFQADLGNLKAQINSVIAKLNELNNLSLKTGAKFTQAMSFNKDAVLARVSAMQKDISIESKYQSKLKATTRAAKNAGKAIEKTAKGIGLHRLDEINLLPTQKAASSSGGSSGSSGSGSGGGFQEANEAASVFLKVIKAVGGSFKTLYQKAKNALSGVAEGFNIFSGGMLGKIAEGLFGDGLNLAETIKGKLQEALQIGVDGAANATTAPESAANKLVSRMANGISAKKAAVSQAAGQVVSAANFSSKSAETQASNAGANLSQGFANGISSKLSAVKSSVSSIVNAAVSKIKEKLKIHSPSKVTFSMGSFFGEGFSGGIAASVKSVQLSAASLSSAAADMLKTDSASFAQARGEGGVGAMMLGAVNEALGNTSLVIPLNVDGVKLGEASIRGINRATRAAGRVLLEI